MVGRREGAGAGWLARCSHQILEATRSEGKEHPGTGLAHLVAVRNVARAEHEVARARLDSLAADLERHLALQDPEGLVLTVMDMQRGLDARRVGDIQKGQTPGGVHRSRLDDGQRAEPPARLSFVASYRQSIGHR